MRVILDHGTRTNGAARMTVSGASRAMIISPAESDRTQSSLATASIADIFTGCGPPEGLSRRVE
ncbi:hypothetical protein [Micromonospora sp. CP22]|uniref:hypothetical protein n=1 Tax=Micromonospora sp. CP22 TaxID=2580517 RepID=UPI0012BC187A|nr:hypothetical protein [Micromonospora sp. CP22]MTK04451.1 hypothetical protein [Micromonospora sp. CP22]